MASTEAPGAAAKVPSGTPGDAEACDGPSPTETAPRTGAAAEPPSDDTRHNGDGDGGDDGAFKRVMVAGLLHVMAWAAILPALAPLLLELTAGDAQQSAELLGWVAATTSAVELAAQPLVGAASDAHGRRPLLWPLMAVSTIAYALIALAPSPGWLLLAAALRGCVSPVTTVLFAMVTDISVGGTGRSGSGSGGAHPSEPEADVHATAAASAAASASAGEVGIKVSDGLETGGADVSDPDPVVVGRVVRPRMAAASDEASQPDAEAALSLTRNMGVFAAVGSVSLLAGPVLGGLAALVGGVRASFVCAALLQAASIGLARGYVPETLATSARVPFSWARASPLQLLRLLGSTPALARLVAVLVAVNLAFSAYNVGPLYTAVRFGWTTLDIGAFLAFGGGIAIVSQGVGTRLAVARWGGRATLVAALLAGILHMCLLALAWRTWQMYAVLMLTAAAWTTVPAVRGLIPAEVRASDQGRLQGAIGCLTTVTSGLGPLASSYVYALSLDLLPAGGAAADGPDPVAGLFFLYGAAMFACGLPLAVYILHHSGTGTARGPAAPATTRPLGPSESRGGKA